MALALRTWPASSLRGRPPLRPRALAATRPALVRSWMSARSNSDSAAKIWKISLPLALVVSMASLRERNPTPASFRSFKIVTRSFRLRPSRSRRQTTRVSPSRIASRHRASSGRDRDKHYAYNILSVKHVVNPT